MIIIDPKECDCECHDINAGFIAHIFPCCSGTYVKTNSPAQFELDKLIEKHK